MSNITKSIWKRLDSLDQTQKGEELLIAKNDPKSGEPDYWWASYGGISLSGYSSLKNLLIDFDRECKEAGYYG